MKECLNKKVLYEFNEIIGVIMVCGHPSSGKSTVVKLMKEKLIDQDRKERFILFTT